jgi:hypothetical protein
MRTITIINVLVALAMLALLACTPAVQTDARPTTSVPADEPRMVDVATPEPYRAQGGRTFLDTLNQGKEVALAADDLPALVVVTRENLVLSSPSGESGGGGPRYRIQILASSQVDMVRREKINAQTAINQPIFMASEQSLFKLYVGDFETRAEAEAALPEVKSKGYADAWIVTTK